MIVLSRYKNNSITKWLFFQ